MHPTPPSVEPVLLNPGEIDICKKSPHPRKIGCSCMPPINSAFLGPTCWLQAINLVARDRNYVAQFSSVDEQCQNRLDKCRRSFHCIKDSGLSFPGTASDVKSYLWKTMCQPICMLYGFDSVTPSAKNLNSQENKTFTSQLNRSVDSLVFYPFGCN